MKLEDVKQAFNGCVSDENCQTILDLVEGKIEIDPTNIPEKFKGTIGWVDQCHSYPSQQELVMKALDDMIDGFGIEAIRGPDDPDKILATYVNTGDTYSSTVVYDLEKDEYVLTTWGDWYSGWIEEQNEENDTIQCGHCSHLTPNDREDWHNVICEQCQNYVDGKDGPGK